MGYDIRHLTESSSLAKITFESSKTFEKKEVITIVLWGVKKDVHKSRSIHERQKNTIRRLST